jgi:hypothetical protein
MSDDKRSMIVTGGLKCFHMLVHGEKRGQASCIWGCMQSWVLYTVEFSEDRSVGGFQGQSKTSYSLISLQKFAADGGGHS